MPERAHPHFTTRQWSILVLAWLGWIFDIADTALFNFAKVPMFTQMLGSAEYAKRGPQVEALVQSVFYIGWAVGGLIFGILADRWGRTRTLVLTVLLYCCFTGITALCRTPEQVAVTRFLTALGIGGEWAAGAALVAEAFSDGSRPLVSSMLQSAAAFGPMLAAVANWSLAGKPWQLLFLLGILPALLCVLARSRSSDPIQIEHAPKLPIAEIFETGRWRRNAIAAMLVGAVGIMGANTATFWQPNLVKEVSIGLSKTVLDQRTSEVAILSHVGTLAGVFVVPWLCSLWGRRKTIGACFALAPASVALAIGGSVDFGRLLLLLPLVNFFSIGVSAAFVLYFPELFPPRIRATGAGLAYNTGRLLAVPMPIATAWAIKSNGGSIASGVLLSGSVYLIGILALAFAPETKGEPLLTDG